MTEIINFPDGTTQHAYLTTDNAGDDLQIAVSDGDLVILDTDENPVLRWDASATQWDFVSQDVVGVASFESAAINNDNYVEPQATASEGTSYNADLSTANYHKVTMTGDVTFDFTNPDSSDVNSLVLHLVQDATGSRTPSFTPTVVWDSGSAPSWSTSANAEDVVTFVHDQDGSQWLGFVGGLGMA